MSGTCQYPFNRSNLLTNFTRPIFSMQSSILGIGKESVLVTEFNLRNLCRFGSYHLVLELIHGELHTLLLGSIMSFSNMYLISLSICCTCSGFTRYGCCLQGFASPTSTSCSTTFVFLGTSVKSS